MPDSRSGDPGSKAHNLAEYPGRSTNPLPLKTQIVIITGTPGVGKSSLAKNLATRIDVPYLSVNSLVRREKLHHGYDRKVSSYILDQNRVSRRIGSILSNTHGAIFDTNYVQGIIPRKRNSIAIVLRLDPVILYNRLRRRGWNKRKCWENAEAELVDSTLIDTINSLGNRRVFQIDTTHRSQAELEKIAMKIINGKMEKSDRIDWLAKYDPIKLQRRFS